MSEELGPEIGNKVIANFFEVWINPEIERRRAQGTLREGFVLHGAQVIFNIDTSPPQVRLNEQVRARAHVKPAMGGFEVGQPVTADDIVEVRSIELTDLDANAGHLTLLCIKGRIYCSFDFRYNAARVGQALEAIQEFLESATTALGRHHMHSFIENLWSATELLAKAYLLWSPDANLLSSKKHNYIHAQFNRSCTHLGNVEPRWVQLLNEMTDLRTPARYLSTPLSLGSERAAQMLADAMDLYAFVRNNNPVRHAT